MVTEREKRLSLTTFFAPTVTLGADDFASSLPSILSAFEQTVASRAIADVIENTDAIAVADGTQNSTITNIIVRIANVATSTADAFEGLLTSS